jgi:hypothetical protein
MSGPMRWAKSGWRSALGMQLTGRATEDPCTSQPRACAIAIRASCVPFALVDNIVKLETADTWWSPTLGATGERA